MNFSKNLSLIMATCLLFGSLAARPKKIKKLATSQKLVMQSAPQELPKPSLLEKTKNLANYYLSLDCAKKCVLTIGIPMLLYQNRYTHFVVYPYLWKQSGPREAIETLTTNGILLLGSTALTEQSNENADGFNASQFAAIIAADYILRQTLIKPLFSRLLA